MPGRGGLAYQTPQSWADTNSTASHLVIIPILTPLEGVLDVGAVLVPALGAAREAVLLAREEAQERAGERYPQPELSVRVCTQHGHDDAHNIEGKVKCILSGFRRRGYSTTDRGGPSYRRWGWVHGTCCTRIRTPSAR